MEHFRNIQQKIALIFIFLLGSYVVFTSIYAVYLFGYKQAESIKRFFNL